MEWIMIDENLIERYIFVLQCNDKYVDLGVDKTSDKHLVWMLNEIKNNITQSETKKHRWLGYVQGIMVAKGYLSVDSERDLTRNVFNGK
jgi:hypothetical protein